MYKEEYFDDMGYKSFNSKNLTNGFYSDETDGEEEVIFIDENRTWKGWAVLSWLVTVNVFSTILNLNELVPFLWL